MYRYLKWLPEPLPMTSSNFASYSTTPQETPVAEVLSGGGIDLPSSSASVLMLPQPPESSSWCAPFMYRFEESFDSLLQGRIKVLVADKARTERMMRRTGGAAHHESSIPVYWVAAGIMGRPMIGIGRVTIGGGAY